MAWTTPKTNWTSTSRFNYTDYNRIKNNILELQSMMSPQPTIESMGSDKAVTSFFYADEANKFWSNTEILSRVMGFRFTDYPIFEPNGRIFFYSELNRLEQMHLTIYEAIIGTMPVYAIDANGVYAVSDNNRAKARAT